MKRKLLAFLIAGAIAISAVPAVSAVPGWHDGINVWECPEDGAISVDLCGMSITNELLDEWVSNGTIPSETTSLSISGDFHRNPWYDYQGKLSDISPLSGLTNLEDLIISGQQVSDLAPLSGLVNLESLIMFGNPIASLAPLSNLTNLERLFLSNGTFSDLAPLSGLTNLTRVILDECQITDVSSLAGLTNLWYLRLLDNPITDISALDGLSVNPIWDGNPDELSTIQLLGILVGQGKATIGDALQILRFAVGLNSIIAECPIAFQAALIVNEETPGVQDALAILRHLVGLPSALDD
jgi:hypothetical protein